MPLLDLFGSLDIIAGAHGVGRLAALHAAHQALQQFTLDREATAFSTQVAEEYRRILRDGSWFEPMRQALDAYVDKIQERVTGTIRVRLFKGECTARVQETHPRRPLSLGDEAQLTWTGHGTGDWGLGRGDVGTGDLGDND
jgi:argininosuccinate synthase